MVNPSFNFSLPPCTDNYPFQEREFARKLHEEAKLPFIEVYLSTPLEVCESRDTKKLYAKARRGEISDFTGITSPYEAPPNADLCLNTAEFSLDECIDKLIHVLIKKVSTVTLHPPSPFPDCNSL